MIKNDLVNRAPSIWASEAIASQSALLGSEELLTSSYNTWNDTYSLGTIDPDFSSFAAIILDDAVSPSGTCIALTCTLDLCLYLEWVSQVKQPRQ